MRHLSAFLELLVLVPPLIATGFIPSSTGPNREMRRSSAIANILCLPAPLQRNLRFQAETYNSASDQVSQQQKQEHNYELRAKQPPRSFRRRMRIRLHRPVRVLLNGKAFTGGVGLGPENYTKKPTSTRLNISTGFIFDDGDQLLVSTQKPLGMVLEEQEYYNDENEGNGDSLELNDQRNGCIVVEVMENSAAERAGVKPGDFLVAVQNVDVTGAKLEEIMKRIGDAPRVVNLRFWRKVRETTDWDDDDY